MYFYFSICSLISENNELFVWYNRFSRKCHLIMTSLASMSVNNVMTRLASVSQKRKNNTTLN